MLQRLLLCIPQLPFDPASGAARSMRTIASMLASAGTDVACVATTWTESAGSIDALTCLSRLGIRPSPDPRRSRPDAPVFRFNHAGVRYVLLHARRYDAANGPGARFDVLFDQELRTFRPDVVLTYGGSTADVLRRRRAKLAGAGVVLGLRNLSYLHPSAFEHVDAVLTPSQFVTDTYRRVVGIDSVPLPTPISLEETIAFEREPVFTTFVNPTPAKGAMLIATLAHELSTARADIPILVIESRGTVGMLCQYALRAGFDLRQHENLVMSAGVGLPRDIFSPTRILLMPSVWAEPSGRLIAEALVNGVPPIASDRGGLPESCAGAGRVIRLPENLTPATDRPVDASVVEPWIEAIIRWSDDDEQYARDSVLALESGRQYHPARLLPRYMEFFGRVADERR